MKRIIFSDITEISKSNFKTGFNTIKAYLNFLKNLVIVLRNITVSPIDTSHSVCSYTSEQNTKAFNTKIYYHPSKTRNF